MVNILSTVDLTASTEDQIRQRMGFKPTEGYGPLYNRINAK